MGRIFPNLSVYIYVWVTEHGHIYLGLPFGLGCFVEELKPTTSLAGDFTKCVFVGCWAAYVCSEGVRYLKKLEYNFPIIWTCIHKTLDFSFENIDSNIKKIYI